MTNCLVITIQVNVSAVDNPEEASFFESYEAAHSSHDLSSTIAEVMFIVNRFSFIYLFSYLLHFLDLIR